MSDIEDYSYSPYDDLEDILYDADPAPELADDLAEHALHSPVYQDIVTGFELQNYHSDWEYYSDDFMDDDPSILKTCPQDGTPPRTQTEAARRQAKPVRKNRKRKLADTDDIPPLNLAEGKLLVRCIKGVQWADHAAHDRPAYTEGQGEKVALMKNWKDLFSITNDGWERSKREKGAVDGEDEDDEDETWANDMSLADMGLRNLQRQTSMGQAEDHHEQTLDTEEEHDADTELEHVENPEDGAADDDSSDLGAPPVPRSARKHRLSGLRHFEISPTEPEARQANFPHESGAGGGGSEDELPRKKQRSAPTLPSPPNSRKRGPAEPPPKNSRPPAIRRTAPRPSRAVKDVKAGSDGGTRGKSPEGAMDRKRKASEDPDTEESNLSRSTASSRAKRVASTTAKTAAGGAAKTRLTRSSKK